VFPEIISEQPEKDASAKSGTYSYLLWRDSEICVLRSTKQMELTVETAGVNQYRTGRHYHRMYLDDIIDDDTVVSETETDNALRFERLLIPMLREQEGGYISQYGTRWGGNDLYGYLIDKITGEGYSEDEDYRLLKSWIVINREVKEPYSVYNKYTPISQEEFDTRKVFDPYSNEERIYIYNYFNDEVLASKRANLDSDYLFFLNYYNRIYSSEDQVFPPPYKELRDLPPGLEYYMTVDPAFTQTRTSDYTALVVCGYSPDGKTYVAEAEQCKVDPEVLLKKMYNYYDKYIFKVCGIEEGSYQGVMGYAFEYARKLQGLPALPIVGLNLGNANDTKNQRIRGLSYFFKRGVVYLKMGLTDLKKQLMRYPGNTTSKDDLLDALSMQHRLHSWNKYVNAEKENYKRKPITYRQYIERGKKKETGYVRY
jgi:predicted phage terminase large subunit-like protein